jgi:hypothetical protein
VRGQPDSNDTAGMGEVYWLNTRPGSRLLASMRACIIAKVWLLLDASRVGAWLRDVCSPSGYERLVIQNAVTIPDVQFRQPQC